MAQGYFWLLWTVRDDYSTGQGYVATPIAGGVSSMIVGKNGDVHQYVKEEDTAYHAGGPIRPVWKLIKPQVNPNYYTIGIEHEGHASDEWTEAQYAASARLVTEIAKRWAISLDADHVVMHREIRAAKTCPGEKFDRGKLLALAGGCRVDQAA